MTTMIFFEETAKNIGGFVGFFAFVGAILGIIASKRADNGEVSDVGFGCMGVLIFTGVFALIGVMIFCFIGNWVVHFS